MADETNISLNNLNRFLTLLKTYISEQISSGGITIDTEMSDTSDNAVQNKVIKAYVDNSLSSNITYGTDDLTAGTSPLATGTVYLVYEE